MSNPKAAATGPKPLSPLLLSLLSVLVGVVAGLGAVVFRGLIGLFHNLLFLGKFSFAYNANVHTPASPWGPLVILVPVFGAAGVAGFPVVPTMSQMPDEEINRRGHSHNDGNPHLRSTQAIEGYHIQTSGGKVGHVTDFIMDDENWAICHLVIETGHWFAGRQIAISPEQIDRISSEESKVFVNVTKAAILEAPEYYVPPLDGASHEAPASPRTPNGQSKSVSF